MMEPKKSNQTNSKAPDPQPEQKQPETKLITVPEKNITDNVLNKVNALEQTGGLQLPPNYSAANALKAAWLILQGVVNKDKKPALQVCNKDSVANALFDMVVQGLNPIKKQCYFVVFGAQLNLMRSYQGTKAVAKRHGAKEIFSNCIYEGDDFEYTIDLQTGLKQLVKHNQKFEDIEITKIKGAYAIGIRENLPPIIEIMNIRQIRNAWEMGYGQGKTDAHKNFTDEMCKKTVESRLCKWFINSSDDSDVISESLGRTLEELPDTPYIEEQVEEEIKENANKQLLDVNPDTAKQEEKPVDTSLKNKDNGKQIEQPALEGPGF